MQIKFLLVAMLSFCVTYVGAQELKGRVVEDGKQGKLGLPGANVYWLGTTRGAVTDMDGNFKIEWNKSGRLIVSFIGYHADTLTVTPNQKFMEITLKSGQELEQVNVVKRGQTTIMNTRGPLIEQVLTGEELCKAACCNLGESFTTNASVDVAYADAVTGAKQIQLLGLTGKYVQMMTENLPNFRGLSSLYGLNYIPGPWMNAISVSKGAGSVLNGYESIAGQISVDYKKPLEEIFFVNAYGSSEGMFEFNTNVGARLSDKWSTMVLAHGDWMNQSLDHHKDGFVDMPKKTQYNLMNRWAYKDDTWYLQFGGKFLDEKRLGGQVGFKRDMPRTGAEGTLYGIGIDARRYEAFMKLGYLMPQYENTSMAFMANYTDHEQESYYGVRDYDARQKTVFLNYVYQSIFGNNENQKFSAGVNLNYDKYDEYFKDFLPANAEGSRMPFANFVREEVVPGVYFQYTGAFWDKFTVMAGLRYDHHNQHGGFVTPRLHLMYAPDEMTTVKFSGGKGYRTANILAENSYLLASAKSIYINDKLLANNPDELDRLDMEEAWNFGINVNRKFLIFDRILNISADYYRTDFQNQIVADNETQAGKVNFYNLTGDSYSNCYQVEVKYELIPRLDVTGAYRYNDVKITMGDRLMRMPLQSRYKGLLNLSYYTNMKKWQFDFTTQFNGGGRMPSNEIVPEEFRTATNFDSFRIMNAQVTKFFRQWSIYAGCENLGNFTQEHSIISADNPWSENFDSSKIWGPIHGRKFYLGVRFAIDRD